MTPASVEKKIIFNYIFCFGFIQIGKKLALAIIMTSRKLEKLGFIYRLVLYVTKQLILKSVGRFRSKQNLNGTQNVYQSTATNSGRFKRRGAKNRLRHRRTPSLTTYEN